MLGAISEKVRKAAEPINALLPLDLSVYSADGAVLFPLSEGEGRRGPGCKACARLHVASQRGNRAHNLVITSPGDQPLCATCPRAADCPFTVVLWAPIRTIERVLGSCSLVGTTQSDREYALQRQAELLALLNSLGDLWAGEACREEQGQKLAEYERFMHGVFEAVDGGLILADRDCRLLRANRWAFEVLGDALSDEGLAEMLSSLDRLPSLYSRTTVSLRAAKAGRGAGTPVKARMMPVFAGEERQGLVLYIPPKSRSRGESAASPGYAGIRLDDIKGSSPQLMEVKEMVRKVAASDVTVLLIGETGTGKEMFARAIHGEGPRSGGPFVAINCAAIPDSLLESELFGYEPGSFTGARREGKKGKFELADGGTIFLDEIGDMSVPLQAKLLRVLQDKQVTRVGGTSPVEVDVRVIAATNQDVEALVRAGKFRADLYYRLNVVPIYIPPLRERKEDIYVLIEHFLKGSGGHRKRFSAEALNALFSYDWPGNVRELENTIKYLVSLEPGEVVEADMLPSRILEAASVKRSVSAEPSRPPVALHQADGPDFKDLHEREKEAILSALAYYGDSTEGKRAAARALGISLSTLYRKLQRYRSTSGAL